MKKILFLGTGGTIASELCGGALSPARDAGELLRDLPGVCSRCDVDTLQLFALDSTDITPAHWELLARTIRENYTAYDGFVIAHGTDTMAYTAAALSYLIQNSEKPIILTGAQKPIGFETTDSKQNLRDSFLCAAAPLHGVFVVFGGQLLLGTRARKTRSKSFSAFSSPNYPPLGIVQNDRLQLYFSPARKKTRFYEMLNADVGLLKLTPGTDAELLCYMLQKYRALVIESFGVGGLPERGGAFRAAVEHAVGENRLVVLTTQVPSEGTDLSVYRVGSTLEALGVLEAHDMTPEACYAKLCWILAASRDPKRQKKLFYTPICHDIDPLLSGI